MKKVTVIGILWALCIVSGAISEFGNVLYFGFLSFAFGVLSIATTGTYLVDNWDKFK